MTKSVNLKKGFTLLEILLVVGIIAILAGIVILAINPTRQLGDARNAQRRSDVLTILNAIYQYSIDNAGDLTALSIAQEATADLECDITDTAATTLTDLTTDSIYLVDLPVDPITVESSNDYYVVQNSDTGRISVCAPNSVGEGSIADDGDQIEVVR